MNPRNSTATLCRCCGEFFTEERPESQRTLGNCVWCEHGLTPPTPESKLVKNVSPLGRWKVKAVTCASCGKLSEGNFSVHRDDFSPEALPLCDECGGSEYLTLDEIWRKIKESREPKP
jgi:hypothetical protein